jgi:hypothetical protein
MVVKLLGGCNGKSTCIDTCEKGGKFGKHVITYPNYNWFGNLILGMIWALWSKLNNSFIKMFHPNLHLIWYGSK